MRLLRQILYICGQCTWGILQTLLGFMVFLAFIRSKHRYYHGSIKTEWPYGGGLSLGLFIFVRPNSNKKMTKHEYGHTIQSLILGPFYLLVIGLPSLTWNLMFRKRRKERQISYGSFYTEKWADYLGDSRRYL